MVKKCYPFWVQSQFFVTFSDQSDQKCHPLWVHIKWHFITAFAPKTGNKSVKIKKLEQLPVGGCYNEIEKAEGRNTDESKPDPDTGFDPRS